MTATQNLLVELFVEELPPKALKKLGEALASGLMAGLKEQGLASDASVVSAFASPRRLAAHVTDVAPRAADKPSVVKLMPVAVALGADGQPTAALLKKLQGLGLDASRVGELRRAPDGKAEALFYDSVTPGVALADGLQKALDGALAQLPIPKLMSYQLGAGSAMPGWTSVSFVRPAHALVALHGAQIIPVGVLGLVAGRETQGHRFEAAKSPVVIAHADAYEETLARDGAVIASFDKRRAEIVRQLADAAARTGEGVNGQPLRPIDDEALLDEVTALVERPKVLVCQFEAEFLGVPQECLILTMKANQKYFPLLDAAGKLTNRFLVVSNIDPADASAVVTGNERVVRPRLADAKFFFDQDRKKSLASRVAGLDKVVYHNKLGSQGERSRRVGAIAQAIAHALGDTALLPAVEQAATLAKADLLTDMVGEFPELQGVMGGYYARHDGLGDEVAQAIEDHYRPRFAGDALPRNRVGVIVALADKLETLVGMFGIGNQPTGDRDPFALRRHALGIVRMVIEQALPLAASTLVNIAFEQFPKGLLNGAPADVDLFLEDRLRSYLKDAGGNAREIEAVLGVAGAWPELPKRLAAVRAFSALPESEALAAANKRITNILKKSGDAPDARVDPERLVEPAERALSDAIDNIATKANLVLASGQFTSNLMILAALRRPVDTFFDQVMVNAEDPALRANRLALLRQLHQAMNRVADLSKLAA